MNIMNGCRFHLMLVFGLLHSLRRFEPFGTLWSISALVFAMYSIVFSYPSYRGQRAPFSLREQDRIVDR